MNVKRDKSDKAVAVLVSAKQICGMSGISPACLSGG